LLHFSSPKVFKTELGVASFLIPKKTVQNGIRADSGVASILIPKIVQNGIRGLLHFSSPKKQFKTVHSKRN
jgi:hypothetical protein